MYIVAKAHGIEEQIIEEEEDVDAGNIEYYAVYDIIRA